MSTFMSTFDRWATGDRSVIRIVYRYCVYRCNIHRVVETENQPLMYIGVHVVYMLSYLCTQVLEINLRVQTVCL